MLYEQLSEDIDAIRIVVLTRKLGPKETEELNALAADFHRWRLRNEAFRNRVQISPDQRSSGLAVQKLAAKVDTLKRDVAGNAAEVAMDHRQITLLKDKVAGIDLTLQDVHADIIGLRGAIEEMAMVFNRLGASFVSVATKMANR